MVELVRGSGRALGTEGGADYFLTSHSFLTSLVWLPSLYLNSSCEGHQWLLIYTCDILQSSLLDPLAVGHSLLLESLSFLGFSNNKRLLISSSPTASSVPSQVPLKCPGSLAGNCKCG